MNRQTIRIVAGANLVAGCLLLQGCGMFGKKSSEQPSATIPEGTATTQTVDQATAPAVPSVETPAAELPPVQNTTAYTIQKGDTISGVAYRLGIRWQDIVAVNPGLSPNKLRVGQVIQLPGVVDTAKIRHTSTPTHKHATAAKTSAPKATAAKTSAPKASAHAAATGSASVYVVKSGDSLAAIAHKHGVKTAALREANGLKSDKLVVGQKLKIPGATKKVSETAGTSKKATATAAKTSAPKTTEKAAPAAATPPPAVEPAAAAPAAAPAVEAAPAAAAATAPAAATAAAPAADSNTQTYTVKEGEDLYAVAIRWGVSPSDLKSLNNLTSTELKAGTVLKIPTAQ